jgi:hypothetical protein
MTSYSGALLAESLRPDAVLDGIPLTVTKIYRAALGDAGAGQPVLWAGLPACRKPSSTGLTDA